MKKFFMSAKRKIARYLAALIALLIVLLFFGGIIAMVLAQIGGIGYAIYQGAHGVEVLPAMWDGFVLWMKMMGGGFAAFALGLIGSEVSN